LRLDGLLVKVGTHADSANSATSGLLKNRFSYHTPLPFLCKYGYNRRLQRHIGPLVVRALQDKLRPD
jgi:hypothetical protein